MKGKNIEKRNRIISTAIVLSMILTAVPIAILTVAPTVKVVDAAGPGGTTPTLRCYGYLNFGAGDESILDPVTGATVEDPPYTDAIAPFNPQHSQAPVKDSITFDPVYLSELESDDELMGVVGAGPLLDQLKYSGQDANEKVFLRQWYEPWHWDKDVNGDGDMFGPWADKELAHGGMQYVEELGDLLRNLPVTDLQDLGWLDEDDEIYPAIMQEYTYMFVDALMIADKPEPVPGVLSAGENSFLFPIGIREDPPSLNPGYQYFWSPYGYGLSGLDANFDGAPDLTFIESEKTLFSYTGGLPTNGIAADFDGNQMIDPLDHDGYQLSGDELGIFRTEQFQLVKGDRVQFLDHMIEVVDTFKNSRVISGIMDPIPSTKVAIWYTGDLEPEFLGYQVIDSHDMVLVGRKLPVTYIRSVVNGGPGTNLCDFPTGPWFIYVHNVDVDEEEAYITVGRALGHAHTAMEDGPYEQDLRHGDPWWLKRFYVDGHEYNVVAIETVGSDNNWGIANTFWTPCPRGFNPLDQVDPVGNPIDPWDLPCFYYNDLDAAWADQAQDPTDPNMDNNEIENPIDPEDLLSPLDISQDYTGFKFITIRTPIPKSGQRQNQTTHDIEYATRDQSYSQQGKSASDIRTLGYYHLIEQHSIRLQPYFICDMLSVAPPFNYEHTVLLDIQKNWSGIWDMEDRRWVAQPEWIGDLKTLIPPITQTTGNYHTLDGRTITPEYMYYVDEGINPQYKGELLEKLYEWMHTGTGGVTIPTDSFIRYNQGYEITTPLPGGFPNVDLNEGWYAEQWNTLPDEYTEFVLPAGGTYDEESPYLYLLTSAFVDLESIGRILNQEWQDDDIADERRWTEANINKATLAGEIPFDVLDLFGTDILDDPRQDIDGPFSHNEESWIANLIYNNPNLLGSAWGGSYTNGIQYIDGNRVKFWFDPALLTDETANDIKKYKTGDPTDTDGIRIYGRAFLGAGQMPTYDPIVPDRGDKGTPVGSDPDMIEYPPYTDPMAPFNPQAWQAPRKDSLTFDPAYMNEYHHGGEELSELYKMISLEESDAREKVFFRMWYEPWHWDKDCNADGSPLGPDALWLLDPDFQEVLWWPIPWLQGNSVPSLSTTDGYVEEYAGEDPPELYGRGGDAGDPWEFLDPDDEIHPALVQEFTYMYVNPYNMPDHGQPGTSRFAFPMASDYTEELWDCFGYGITNFDADFDTDMNNDGEEDIKEWICTVHSEQSLYKRTGIRADFNGDGLIQMLDQDDIALNGNEIVIFAVENINLATGDSAMFLDNMVTVGTITADSVSFDGYRTSGATAPCIQPLELGGESNLRNVKPGEMVLVRHTEARVKIPAGGNNLNGVDGAWFLYVESIDNAVSPPRCVVTLGRALGCTHTAMDLAKNVVDNTPGDPWYMKRFYVDGHEYNVVAIMTVKEDIRQAGGWANSKEECYEFKYITIQTEVPKVPVTIEQHSVRKQEYIPCSMEEDHFISVMPPFNYYHTCKADIRAGWATNQTELEELSDNDYKGDVIKNKPPLQIHIEKEERETQYKGELKEKYNKRPLIDLTVPMEGDPLQPLPLGVITGWVDGRAVRGSISSLGTLPWTADGINDNIAEGCYRWALQDDDTGVGDRIYNDNGQDVSTMMGKFIFYDWDNDGDKEWIMCVDYLNPLIGNLESLNEDYLCFFAVYNEVLGRFLWLPDNFNDGDGNYPLPTAGADIVYVDGWVEWESWMTEQWHTIPDQYTEISIDQGTDDTKYQLSMLTSSWIAPESQLRIPYYEDGALRNNSNGEIEVGEEDWYEFYVPLEILPLSIPTVEIFLYWKHDSQNIDLALYAADRTTLLAWSNGTFVSQEVISIHLPPGKFWVRVWANGTSWHQDLEPEPYELYIEVRGEGARVKFWYDPENCDDIYVNTVDLSSICGGCNCRKGDKNNDCAIGFADLDAFGLTFGTSCGDQGYDACFDFYDDCNIGFDDLDKFGEIFGQTYCDCEPCIAPPWEPWPESP